MKTHRVSMLRALRLTTWDNWQEAVWLMLFSAIGGLAPVWIGWILLRGYGSSASIVSFAKAGEFALYSAALMAPTIYTIVSERSPMRFVGQPAYMLLAVTGLVLSIAAYAMIAPVAIGVLPFAGLQIDLIATGTLALYCFCLALSFLVTGLDNARTSDAVTEIVRAQREALDREFDRLGGGHGTE